MENNKNSWILALMPLFIFLSCKQQSEVNQREVNTNDTTRGKIVYVLDSNITKFIEDSIMDKSLKAEIFRCKFSTDNSITHLSFRYEDDDFDPILDFLIKNTNRYLKIRNYLIPIDFEEDKYIDASHVDMSKSVRKTTNWMNYAELKFNTKSEIIEYNNFYKRQLKAGRKIR